MWTALPRIVVSASALCLTAAIAPRPAHGGAVVRVQRSPGGPRITLNGKAVRPWMFFGNPRTGKIHAGGPWKRVEFTFFPEMDIPGRGTLHFRFGRVPGDVWVRNVSIVENRTGRTVLASDTFASEKTFNDHWDVWPPGKRNTVGKVEIDDGMLHVRLTAPAKGRPWPDFHIPAKTALTFHRNQEYTGAFEIRANPPRDVTVSVYFVTGGVWRHIATAGEWSGDNVFLHQVGLARDAGVRFITFSCPYYPSEPGKPQYWNAADKLCRAILRVHPDALLIPRIGMGAPGWWYEKHPEAQMVFEDGKPVSMPSVSSREYRRDASEWLARFCRHMMKAFPDHFSGVHPCGQNTGEWFYYRSWNRPLSGYDPATLKAWRAWLKQRGAPDADSASVPSPESRHAAPNGLLRSPVTERRLIEFSRFRQREMADTVLALAAAARQATAGEKLVVFFYGYLFEFGALPNGAQQSGHYALRRVLASPDIDILCSPISYFDRQWLGTGPCMTAAESVTAAGKLWLNEDDTRTWPAKTTRYGGARSTEETQAILTRNLAQESLRGFGTWWMDLQGLGWYDDVRIWDVMRRLQPLGDAMLGRRRPYTPDVALIIGEDSMCCLAGGANSATRPLIYESRAAFGRAAQSYGQYLLADAATGKVPARLHIYLAAWRLLPRQCRELAADNSPERTRVWCWALPGWIDGDRNRNNPNAMFDITGFHGTPAHPKTAQVRATARGRAFGFPETWGVDKPIQPLFSVTAAGGEVLAVWRDGSPAVAFRARTAARGAEIFYGVPSFTPAVARALIRIAGLTPVVDSDATAWAAGPRLFLYPLTDGEQGIRVGGHTPVTDGLSGRRVGAGPEFPLLLHAGEPRFLDLGR